MLRTRIITAVVLSCLLLAGLFLPPPPWAVLAFGAVFTIAAWEWARFGELCGGVARMAYAAGIALLLLACWRWSADPGHLIWLLSGAVGWWVLAFLWLQVAPEQHRPNLTLLCGAAVLVPAFTALARLLCAGRGTTSGAIAVLWLILLVVAADVGAYTAGRLFGRHKLAPRVSPGKTWEGAAGGLVSVGLLGAGGAVHFGLPALVVVPFACAVGLFSVIGDLTESMFKRSVGVKDSGVLLPGHGGLLDRIDSVTAAAPLYALGLFSCGVMA